MTRARTPGMQNEETAVATARDPSVLELTGVTLNYQTKSGVIEAVASFDLAVPQSEFLSIVGPSGCGKSTILMTMAGLRHPTSGTVRYRGVPLQGPLLDGGIVFQTDALLDWRSALDNVLLQVELRGLRKSEYRETAAALLASVGLGEFAEKRPYELSGGMRQRVALCRSLVHSPSVLLMDEPFAALDAMTRDQVGLDLQALWIERQPTVVFVTHSISEAILLSDRVVVMSLHPGRIVKTLCVPFGRPRSLDVEETAPFQELVAEIRSLLAEGGPSRPVG